ARDALAAHRSLLRGRRARSPRHPPADDVRALRNRALRVRLPGERDRAQRRGPQRDGLQPLRRDTVLLQQLPVQGAPVQLLQLHVRHRRRRAPLLRPQRSGHAPAHCLPRPGAQPEPGAVLMAMTAAALAARQELEPLPLLEGEQDDGTLNKTLLDYVWRKPGKGWWLLFLIGVAGTGMLLMA